MAEGENLLQTFGTENVHEVMQKAVLRYLRIIKREFNLDVQ